MRIRKPPLKGLGEWSRVASEYRLEVFAGPKESETNLYVIKSDEPIMPFSKGDIIDAKHGVSPGLADLEQGRYFEVTRVEKAIQQSLDGDSIIIHTVVFTNPLPD